MTVFESVYRFFGWWIININLFFLILLFVGRILFFFQKKIWGNRFSYISAIALIFFGFVPFGIWAFDQLENRFPKIHQIPPDAKGMILLGGPFDQRTTLARGETAYNLTAGRFIQFIELARENPHLQLVFTGTAFEVEMAKKQFKALGLDPSVIIFEGSSKDTKDNAVLTAQLIKPTPQEKWVLITSAYHMPRSVGVFRKAGFNIIPFPVDYHSTGKYDMVFFLSHLVNLEAWQAISREWLGMIMNYLIGRSDELFPKPSES